MATLAADTRYKFSEPTQKGRDLPVVASDIIYKHAAVGISSGYARPLAAGDKFCGFAVEQVDNSAGSAGDKYVELYVRGEVEVPVSSAAVTDIHKAVYMSDDNTFTFTAGSNSYLGVVVAWVSTGVVLVSFDASRGSLAGIVTAITDNSSGTASDTIAAIGATYDQDEVRNAVASLAAKINELLKRLND